MDYPFTFFQSSCSKFFWISILYLTLSFIIIKTLRHFSANNSLKSKLPPSPKLWPIVGNLPQILTNKPVYLWIHKFMKELNTDIACLHLGNVHVILVTCPAIAREFLRKSDAIFASRPITMSTDIISSNMSAVFSPYGQQWKKMKKIIIHDLLSPDRLQWLQDKRNEEADNLVFYVFNKCKNDSNNLVNIRIAAQHYSGNVYRKLVFNTRYFGKGMKDGGPGIEEEEHVNAAFTLLRYTHAFSISDYVPCLKLLDLDGHKSKVKNAMKIIERYHDSIIEERSKMWSDGSNFNIEDWLDVLISLTDENGNQSLTLKEIKGQLIELLMAIVDNPSNGVEWAIAEMINQPDLLKQATEELDNVVGKHRLVQESDLPKLRFVTACARESFRLHPMAPFNVPHVSMNDTMIADYFIPKGSHVFLSKLGLGRNPKVWNEPYKFNPKRHLKNDGENKIDLTEPDLKFISFSTGRRGCSGVILGTTMTLMLFARLLHCFNWSAAPNTPYINLVESKDDLFLAEPLVAVAKPRLAAELYNCIK